MSTTARERIFSGLLFIPTEQGRYGRLEHTKSPLYKRFQFREDLEEPLPDLENLRNRTGFNLWLVGTWSDNFGKGIGYDPQEQAVALTSTSIREGSFGEFAAEGLHILEVGIRNLRPIPDVAKISLELKYRMPIKYNRGDTRWRTGFRIAGSLPNIYTSQERLIEGLITLEEVAGIKKETTTYAGQKYTPQIPGVINSWATNGRRLPQYVMVPADPVVLNKLRGSVRITYN